jgi:iron complex transport system ATP-binding protein
MSELLKLVSGTFNYGERVIFKDLDLSVNRGDVLYILGANGCGKTTLLRCLNGALKLKSGRVLLENLDIKTMSAIDIAKHMGFVFQEHSAPFPFTVMEVVRMGRAPYLGMFSHPGIRDDLLAEQALDMVGMLHLKDKPYTQISGGERQLVLIARTLTQEPQMVLLDEPTSHLDFKNQTLVLRMVNMMAENGMTVVMTTHLPNHAMQFSNKVVLMNNGEFLASGSPEGTLTEEHLRKTYGINVKIYSASSTGKGSDIKYCIASTDPQEVIVTGQSGVETTLRGKARLENGLACIDIGENIVIQATVRRIGMVKIVIPSEGMILSRRNNDSGARNVFKGKITGIIREASSIRIRIDIGRTLDVLITSKSYEEMNPQSGEDIYVTIKATSVRAV